MSFPTPNHWPLCCILSSSTKNQFSPENVLLCLTLWSGRWRSVFWVFFLRSGRWWLGLWVLIAAAKSRQLCRTVCDPIDSSPPGSPVPGILQARTTEWVAISFSNAGKWKVKVKSLSHVRLFATPWTAAHQAPPSMGLYRQEYWSGVPLPSPSPY